MIDNARKYTDQVRAKMLDTWYDDKYKYYFCNPYHKGIDIPNDDYNEMHFVSLDNSKNVIGYISYTVDRFTGTVDNFGAINFSDKNKFIFGNDLYKVIDNIFSKFNFQRLEFAVTIGNPIEKTYDKMIEKLNGRIIGIRRKCTKLPDNTLYDEKLYEILNEDYFSIKL
jgi:hypothetical protein